MSSYRQCVADCPDSWENMIKGTCKGSMKSNEKIMGKTGLRDETQSNVSHFCDRLDSVDIEELVVEVTRLKKDIEIIKDEIIEIKAENNELKRQKEELKDFVESLEQKKETAAKRELQQSNGTKETKQRFLVKAKIVKQKLQIIKGYKTATWRKESLIQQLHDVILRINEWNQTRM